MDGSHLHHRRCRLRPELRTESVQGQLNGTIPATSDGQSADRSSLVDASAIELSDMGTMNMGGFGGGMPAFENSDVQVDNTQSEDTTNSAAQSPDEENNGNTPQNPFGENGEIPDFGNMQFPQGSGGTQNNTLSYILFGVSALLLAGSLLFAFKFKR